MKKKLIATAVACFLLSVTSYVFAGGVTITGPSTVTYSVSGVFYATLHSTPPATGYSANWSFGGDPSLEIIAQNTNPQAGALYVWVRYTDSASYQATVYFNDNQGNNDYKTFNVAAGLVLAPQAPLVKNAPFITAKIEAATTATAAGEVLRTDPYGFVNREAVRKYAR